MVNNYDGMAGVVEAEAPVPPQPLHPARRKPAEWGDLECVRPPDVLGQEAEEAVDPDCPRDPHHVEQRPAQDHDLAVQCPQDEEVEV